MNWWGGVHLLLSLLAFIVGLVVAFTLRAVGHDGGTELLPAGLLVALGLWGMVGWLGLDD